MIFFVVSVAGLVLAALVGRGAFDKLVKHEYTDHRGSWEADGRPEGTWGYHGEFPAFWGHFAGQWLWLKWCFVTPAWARPRVDAVALLRRHRASAGLSLLAIVAGVVAQVVFG